MTLAILLAAECMKLFPFFPYAQRNQPIDVERSKTASFKVLTPFCYTENPTQDYE